MNSAETIQKIADTVAEKLEGPIELTKPAVAMLVQEWRMTGIAYLVTGVLFLCASVFLFYIARKRDKTEKALNNHRLDDMPACVLPTIGGMVAFLIGINNCWDGIMRLVGPHITLLKDLMK